MLTGTYRAPYCLTWGTRSLKQESKAEQTVCHCQRRFDKLFIGATHVLNFAFSLQMLHDFEGNKQALQ